MSPTFQGKYPPCVPYYDHSSFTLHVFHEDKGYPSHAYIHVFHDSYVWRWQFFRLTRFKYQYQYQFLDLEFVLDFSLVNNRAISPMPMFLCNDDDWDYWIATCSNFDCSFIPSWPFLYKDTLMPMGNNVNGERRVNVRLGKQKWMSKEIQVCPTSLFISKLKYGYNFLPCNSLGASNSNSLENLELKWNHITFKTIKVLKLKPYKSKCSKDF